MTQQEGRVKSSYTGRPIKKSNQVRWGLTEMQNKQGQNTRMKHKK